MIAALRTPYKGQVRLLKKLINERPGLQKPPGAEAVAAAGTYKLCLFFGIMDQGSPG